MFSVVHALVRRVFDLLGFFPRNAKLVFIGLDNAGKTTLLQMLTDNTLRTHQPTIHANCAEMMIGSIHFRAHDLGGHETARRTWRDYTASVDGIVFLVDAADRTRFSEAKEELARVLDDPALQRTPIAILGNKIDIPKAACEEELRNAVNLPHHMTCHIDSARADKDCRPVQLFMCSIVKRMGYADAFHWLGRMAAA